MTAPLRKVVVRYPKRASVFLSGTLRRPCFLPHNDWTDRLACGHETRTVSFRSTSRRCVACETDHLSPGTS